MLLKQRYLIKPEISHSYFVQTKGFSITYFMRTQTRKSKHWWSNLRLGC